MPGERRNWHDVDVKRNGAGLRLLTARSPHTAAHKRFAVVERYARQA
jgi:hypothetical protein